MLRDLRRLADSRFDLVIVGAGIYGAIAAWDAALRGLSVALIDMGDFGAGTSFNNLKTLHGGLRSLQGLDVRQMRLFIRERRAMARIAPHLVRPLSFVVPTYRDPRRSRTLMRIALIINEVVSSDRHHGLSDPSLQLTPGHTVSRGECLRLNPIIEPDGVTGGAVWHDYQLENSDRMTFSFVLSAVAAGAVVANYARAVAFLRSGVRISGVRVEDRLTSEQFDIRGTIVLNAAGPWASALLATLDRRVASPAPRLSRAINLVTRAVTGTHACGGLADGRFLFVVPWRNVSVIGTSHDAYDGNAETVRVSRDDLEAFLAGARQAFPEAALTAADVRLVHRGLLPMVSGHATSVRLLRESAVIDHRRDKLPGLISMFGVRYTTARDTAARAIDAVFRASGDRPPPCRTGETAVTGGAIGNKDSFLRAVSLRDIEGVAPATLRRLAATYGTTYDAVLQTMRDQPGLACALGRDCAVTAAEVVHAVRHEAAVKLGDALIRRTEAGSAGYPGRDAIDNAARIMARELGWNEERTARDVTEVEEFYRLPE